MQIKNIKKLKMKKYIENICESFPCIVTSREICVEENGDIKGIFEIGPLEIGQGINLGSTLRRAILGRTTGCVVTGFKLNDARHEFSSVSNIKEDLLDVIANLKGINFRAEALDNFVIGHVCCYGPKIITAGMFSFGNEMVSITNPNQYICLVTAGPVILEIEVSNATGYVQASNIETEKESNVISLKANEGTYPAFIKIDANFSSVKKVNYKVKLGHDINGILSDIVEFTVVTNGTCSPRRIISEGAKEVLKLFYPLLLTPELIAQINNNF